MFPYDVYALSNQRDLPSIQHFLECYGAGMKETSINYPLPQYSDSPSIVFRDIDDLLHYLVNNRQEPYSVYFHHLVPPGEVLNCMLVFTSDGQVVYGITVSHVDECRLAAHLRSLLTFVNGEAGYVAVEEPPPLTATEFLEVAREAALAQFH